MWLARNKKGKLTAFNMKPYYSERIRCWFISDEPAWNILDLSKEEFPEVTFENSPVEIVTLSK